MRPLIYSGREPQREPPQPGSESPQRSRNSRLLAPLEASCPKQQHQLYQSRNHCIPTPWERQCRAVDGAAWMVGRDHTGKRGGRPPAKPDYKQQLSVPGVMGPQIPSKQIRFPEIGQPPTMATPEFCAAMSHSTVSGQSVTIRLSGMCTFTSLITFTRTTKSPTLTNLKSSIYFSNNNQQRKTLKENKQLLVNLEFKKNRCVLFWIKVGPPVLSLRLIITTHSSIQNCRNFSPSKLD